MNIVIPLMLLTVLGTTSGVVFAYLHGYARGRPVELSWKWLNEEIANIMLRDKETDDDAH